MHHANGVVWEAVSPPPPPLPPLCAAPYPAVPRDGDDGAADDDAPRLWLLLFLEEEEPYPIASASRLSRCSRGWSPRRSWTTAPRPRRLDES